MPAAGVNVGQAIVMAVLVLKDAQAFQGVKTVVRVRPAAVQEEINVVVTVVVAVVLAVVLLLNSGSVLSRS